MAPASRLPSTPKALALTFLLVLMGLFVASCTVEPAEGYEQLTDIDGVEQLSTEFNEQEGSPRLILLLSPT